MNDNGIFILAMILLIGEKEVIVKEYGIFDSYDVCESYKPDFEKLLNVPLTCITEGET